MNSDYEKLGAFYVGREVDAATGQTRPEPLLLDSRDLTTHAVCVGMTGSGKTGLCQGLLEEAAIDGVPAICCRLFRRWRSGADGFPAPAY